MAQKDDRERLLTNGGEPKIRQRSSNTVFYLSLCVILLLLGLSFFTYGVFHFISAEENVDEELLVDNLSEYFVGVGRYDVTGPITQVNMMGYADPSQTAHGLHMRLYARSFIVRDLQNKTSVVFVTVDSGMGAQIVKLEVVKRLKAKYGNLYTERNVVISGTHSHSGPAGFFQFMLFEVTSLGFIKQTTDAFVDGITQSIIIAHNSMQRGRLSLAMGEVDDANINRSPSAYEHNTAEERAKYKYNTEHGITGLQLSSSNGEPLGLFTWYPVHGTSMNESNTMISSDNRGRASALFERMMKKDGELPGRESFVGAFAAANLGDVSPNTKGPICIDSGEQCDYEKSTCGDPPSVKYCIAFGPGDNMIESTDIIGTRQYDAMKKILQSGTQPVSGQVSFKHQYVDMTKEEVTLADGSKATTCKPAMGYSFAAGTTDGPGAFDFHQSMTEGTTMWDSVRDIIEDIVCSEKPTQEYYDCHKPKPVLLPTGYMDIPYAWHPSIVDVQLLQVGQLLIAAVPGEFTTMAGRRLKDAIKQEAMKHGMPSSTQVVIAGLSNVYTHYITTLEEYGAQRYEGGSTIFGPHSHAAYVQKFVQLTDAAINDKQVEPGPSPANLLSDQIELLPPPAVDSVPSGKEFGDVITDVRTLYMPGDFATVKFYGANPRNNMKLNQTYFEVQRQNNDKSWSVIFTDSAWETRLKWESQAELNNTKSPNKFLGGMFKMLEKIIGHRIELDKIRNDLESIEQFSLKNRNIQDLVSMGVLTPVDPINTRAMPQVSEENHITIEWEIPLDQPSGTYRIVYYGDRLKTDNFVVPFTGYSSTFTVNK